MTPIILLHHNEPDFLESCIYSIIKNTKSQYKIIVIDNKSTKKNIEKIKILNKKIKFKLIFNPKDNWVLGFNLGIEYLKKYKWDRIVLSDSDIIFNRTQKKKCWLKYLNDQFDLHPTIGKLGISLDRKILKKNKILNQILKRENRYNNGIFIGENVIAPTDTTAAIYRKDLFITKEFKLYYGHTSLIKPYYYSCRTGKMLNCKHLGWYKYLKIIHKQTIKDIRTKAWFFCRVNRPIESPLLNKLPIYEKILLLFLAKYFYRTIISIKFLYLWTSYILKNFPLNFNEIQRKKNY